MTPTPSSRFGHAWVALTLTLAGHVVDEAVTDLLGVYNPIVHAARARVGWFPMPELTFAPWLAGLCVLVLLLLALVPPAYRGSRGCSTPRAKLAADGANIDEVEAYQTEQPKGSDHAGSWHPQVTKRQARSHGAYTARSSWLFTAPRWRRTAS